MFNYIYNIFNYFNLCLCIYSIKNSREKNIFFNYNKKIYIIY